MAASLRFVFDTNAIVSAVLLKQSVSRQAFDKALGAGKILTSASVLEELNDVLSREQFKKYVTDEERTRFLAAFLKEALLVEITESIVACRDLKDDKFLELAVSGNANVIVSGDNDLLALHPFRGIPILTPRAFLAHLAAQN